MGRPSRVDDDELVTTVAKCASENDRGWATTGDIAANLPLEHDSTRKRLNRAIDETDIERWKPHGKGSVWRVSDG